MWKISSCPLCLRWLTPTDSSKSLLWSLSLVGLRDHENQQDIREWWAEQWPHPNSQNPQRRPLVWNMWSSRGSWDRRLHWVSCIQCHCQALLRPGEEGQSQRRTCDKGSRSWRIQLQVQDGWLSGQTGRGKNTFSPTAVRRTWLSTTWSYPVRLIQISDIQNFKTANFSYVKPFSYFIFCNYLWK